MIDKGDLLAERVVLIDGVLCSRKTGKPIHRRIDKGGYIRFKISYQNKAVWYSAHRAIWFLHYGAWPKDTIDHINHVRTDNRIENLRDISREENSSRKFKQARPRSQGWVTPFRTGWQAFIRAESRRKLYLGKYPKFEEAEAARKAAARLLAELCAEPALLGELAGRPIAPAPSRNALHAEN
jgi:hypothetical protein